jgi:hypothetical protein
MSPPPARNNEGKLNYGEPRLEEAKEHRQDSTVPVDNTIATGGLVNLPGEVTKGIQARDPRSRMNDRRSFEEATGRQA